MRFAGIAFALALVAGLAAALLIPEKSLSPGHLSAAHQNLSGNCLSCHALGSGAPAANCVSCHRPGEIGLTLVNGDSATNTRPGIAGLHKAIASLECAICHSEHGVDSGKMSENFSHNLLPSDLAGNCIECHDSQKPADQIHRELTFNCNKCHTTDGWKPAHFNHDLLDAAELQSCAACHQSKVPDDLLHKSIGSANCADCHATTAWKPSTFDHTKYFRFDRDHPARCADCHNLNVSLKTYTCYNCHEHSPQKIAREHIEEGIRNFENCVSCHRSANKHEAEGRENGRGGREGRQRDSDDD